MEAVQQSMSRAHSVRRYSARLFTFAIGAQILVVLAQVAPIRVDVALILIAILAVRAQVALVLVAVDAIGVQVASRPASSALSGAKVGPNSAS